MTSSDLECNQDRDPLAEGSELGPHAINEVDGLFDEFREMPETNERPMIPERPETRLSKNPVRHQTTTSQEATARQHVAAEAIVLDANALPNRQDRLGPSKATTEFREGEAKTS